MTDEAPPIEVEDDDYSEVRSAGLYDGMVFISDIDWLDACLTEIGYAPLAYSCREGQLFIAHMADVGKSRMAKWIAIDSIKVGKDAIPLTTVKKNELN